MWRLALRAGIVDGWNCAKVRICVRWLESSVDKMNIAPDEEVEKHSFAKDWFLGKFDVGIFTFPEMPDPENLERRLLPVKEYFLSKVKSDVIDREGHIPTSIMDDLKQFGLFGPRVPWEYGGLGLSALEYTRMREVTAMDSSISDMLYGHEALGLQGILLHGNDQQKRKYLPKLAKGEWIAALCISENAFGMDMKAITTRATNSDDDSIWMLNGKKTWVINGPIADVFVVLALTKVQDRLGKVHDTYIAFIVEKDFGGITVGKPKEKLGKRGTAVCEVTFKDTPVPAANILGKIGSGFQMTTEILSGNHFSAGSAAAGLLKNLIKSAAEFSQLEKVTLGRLMTQVNLVEVTCTTYAMESMSYVAAGILDRGQSEDCSLESAVIKVFSSEKLWNNIQEFQALFGSSAFVEGSEYERIFRDSRSTITPVEENYYSRLFIALSGLQHSGICLQETVTKLRNPLFFPGFLVKNFFKKGEAKDKRKLFYGAENFIHPCLEVQVEQLQKSLLYLRYSTEMLLLRYGQEVTKYEIELIRLADLVINIFAMTAVMARASYSYSAGFKNSDYEIMMAKMFCSSALQEVELKAQDIMNGPMMTGDFYHPKVASKVFKTKGYFPQHPLTRNF